MQTPKHRIKILATCPLLRVLKKSPRTSCSRTRASKDPLRSWFFGIPAAAGMAKKGVYQHPLLRVGWLVLILLVAPGAMAQEGDSPPPPPPASPQPADASAEASAPEPPPPPQAPPPPPQAQLEAAPGEGSSGGEEESASTAEPAKEADLPPAKTEPAIAGEAAVEAPEPTSKSVEATEEEEEPAKPMEFIKGELIHVGTRRLLSRFDHVGMAMGLAFIDSAAYLSLEPGVAYYGDELAVSCALPLKLLLVDTSTLGLENFSVEFGKFRVRRQDWDEIPEFAKVIRFLTMGRKEDNLYLTLNSLRPATIGHGQVLNKYQANIEVDRSMTGLVFDAYNEYGGFQLQANDITFANRLLGALIFFKPFSLLSDDILAQSVSLGLEYVGDFAAPRCVRFGSHDSRCVQGRGHRAGFDPYTGESLDRTFVNSDPKTGRFVVENTTVHAAGFSGEAKVLKDERNMDLKVYGTFHRFLNSRGGNGLAVGALGRFNAGDTYRHAFRVRAEYRAFGDGYAPGYFDSLYEIGKYGYALESQPYQVRPTKYQAVFGDPENGFPRRELGWRHGINVEAAWGLFKGSRSGKQVALGIGIEDSTGPDDTRFYTHVEFPMLGFMQLFLTYMKVNDGDFTQLFSSDMFTAYNTVMLSGLRLQIIPPVFSLNVHYSRSYRIVRGPGREYHLGNDTIVDADGNISPYFPEAHLYENVHTVVAEFEFGWEFR